MKMIAIIILLLLITGDSHSQTEYRKKTSRKTITIDALLYPPNDIELAWFHLQNAGTRNYCFWKNGTPFVPYDNAGGMWLYDVNFGHLIDTTTKDRKLTAQSNYVIIECSGLSMTPHSINISDRTNLIDLLQKEDRYLLTRNELMAIPATDINDLLSIFPNVYQAQRGGNISVSGARTDGNQYILDGMQLLRR